MNIYGVAIVVTFVLVSVVAGYALMNKDNAVDLVADDHAAGEAMESYEISPGTVSEKIEQGEDIILLDVRTPEEYAEVHLEGALLLPVQELSSQSLARIGLGEDAKDTEIIIYCRSGARSKTAYDIMQSLGDTNIKSVAGGMIHWEEDGYPFTESGAYVESNTIVANDTQDTSQAVPRITIDRMFHDFGLVPQYGGVVQEIFTVTNTGNATLTVGDITTSCSCTSASISQTTLGSGESAQLTVVFDPDFHEEPLGVFKRTVFIPTNDPAIPEMEVTIQVDIVEGT